MAKRKLLCKLNAKKAVRERERKREERRESAAKTREARLAKKAIQPPDEQPSNSAEAVFDAPIGDEEVLLVPFPTTNDVQTQTDQEFSIERLCAELNAARRRITLLERNLRIKEEELASTRSRPESRTGREPRRALSLDQLTPSTRTRRAKAIAVKIRQFFSQNHRGKLLIAILDDRGCASVKIGLQIGNLLSDVNSPRNFTLVAFWEGPETRSEMENRLQPVLVQLAQLSDFSVAESGPKLTIEWFLCGDMSFICAWLGRMGPAAVFPCALCRVPYHQLGNAIVWPRTIQSMERGAMIFEQKTRGSKHTTADSVASGSQKALPLFAVLPQNVIPSPFYTMHSAGRKCIDFFEKNTNPVERERRLLRASEEIRSIGTLFASDIADLLNDVRELHTYARAFLMSPQQIHNFEAKCFAVHSYFRTLWESHPTELETDNASGFTPKLHWLLAHGPDFAKRWGWFGFLSEQSVEHLHHVLNKQGDRFKHFKGDELLLKIGEHQTLVNAVFDRHLGW
uniref:Uncharacterized protein n=1 Tax=Globodera rostochiensis TaxID=31243 RepID=A0A914I1J2_GLORO